MRKLVLYRMRFPRLATHPASPPSMAAANDLRKGQAIRYNGDIYVVLEVTHRTPGNLRAFVQAIIRSIKTGKSSDVRFSSTEKVELVEVQPRDAGVFLQGYRTAITSWTPTPTRIRCCVTNLIGHGQGLSHRESAVTVLYAEGKPVEVELPSQRDAQGGPDRRRRARRQRQQRPKARHAGNRQDRAGALFIKEGEAVKISTSKRRVHGPGVSRIARIAGFTRNVYDGRTLPSIGISPSRIDTSANPIAGRFGTIQLPYPCAIVWCPGSNKQILPIPNENPYSTSVLTSFSLRS